MALLLRKSDIEGLMDVQQAIRVLEKTYHHQAQGGPTCLASETTSP